MGTIGDRFGDLAALFGAEGEAAPENEVGSQPTDEPRSEAAAPVEIEAAPTLESVLAQTIKELNRVESSVLGSAVDLDLDFQALDLSGLPLWALVAEVERFLGRKFTDDQVETWESPRDILRAAEDIPG